VYGLGDALTGFADEEERDNSVVDFINEIANDIATALGLLHGDIMTFVWDETDPDFNDASNMMIKSVTNPFPAIVWQVAGGNTIFTSGGLAVHPADRIITIKEAIEVFTWPENLVGHIMEGMGLEVLTDNDNYHDYDYYGITDWLDAPAWAIGSALDAMMTTIFDIIGPTTCAVLDFLINVLWEDIIVNLLFKWIARILIGGLRVTVAAPAYFLGKYLLSLLLPKLAHENKRRPFPNAASPLFEFAYNLLDPEAGTTSNVLRDVMQNIYQATNKEGITDMISGLVPQFEGLVESFFSTTKESP
jgi:hypothetical protein